MLWQLASTIESLGYPVMTLSSSEMEQTNWDCKVSHENTIVVFAEGYPQSCLHPPRVTVRWLLAPIGTLFGLDTVQHWDGHDWIFSYGFHEGKDKPLNNDSPLVVIRNPYPGDMFDPSKYSFDGERNGTCHTDRKKLTFHSPESDFTMHGNSSWKNCSSVSGRSVPPCRRFLQEREGLPPRNPWCEPSNRWLCFVGNQSSERTEVASSGGIACAFLEPAIWLLWGLNYGSYRYWPGGLRRAFCVMWPKRLWPNSHSNTKKRWPPTTCTASSNLCSTPFAAWKTG